MLQRVACVAMLLQCVAVCCSVLTFAALTTACHNMLQRVAVCCSVSLRVAVF